MALNRPLKDLKRFLTIHLLVFALLGSLAYAEIALVINKSGGSYAFFLEVFGPEVAFMQMILTVFLTSPSSAAAIALACSEYILYVFFDDGCFQLPQDIAITLAIFIVGKSSRA